MGPRQCGKTTLAREITASRSPTYFDLEDPRSAARLGEPMTALGPLRGLIVIDEVQLAPALFPVLRVLADRPRTPARFLLLGSASAPLAVDASESLAGRVAFVEMSGFTLDELGASAMRRLWLRGGFPRAYLARSLAASARWREDFARTFLERDLPQLGARAPVATYPAAALLRGLRVHLQAAAVPRARSAGRPSSPRGRWPRMLAANYEPRLGVKSHIARASRELWT